MAGAGIDSGASDGVAAVVFDLDGVIVDSEPYSMQALRDVLREYGIEPSAEELRRSFGRRVRDDLAAYFARYGVRADLEAAVARKQARYYELAAGHLRPFPGVLPLLDRLRQRGYRLGLASSGDRRKVAFSLQALHLDGCFDSVVTGDDVTHSKPHPEIYRLAAQRLGVAPGACVAIEDAPTGVQAAKRAGLRCIAVSNSVPRHHLQAADLVVASLEEELSPVLPLEPRR
jgi:HAD superfamily hydrolase (TIGR01509 family)